LLATSGDYLRIWRAGEPETRLECILNNVSIYLFTLSIIVIAILRCIFIKTEETILYMTYHYFIFCIVWFYIIYELLYKKYNKNYFFQS
jgi:hypothetical protein